MKEKNHIINFINNVGSNNFKKADSSLAEIVNEKLKHRIRVAQQKLTAKK